MRAGPIQRHHCHNCVHVSEKHPDFMKPLLTLPVKACPEAVLCYPEHSSGQDVLLAQTSQYPLLNPQGETASLPSQVLWGQR